MARVAVREWDLSVVAMNEDLDDLATSEWGHGQAWDEKVARARARVARIDWPPLPAMPCDGTCETSVVRRLALRPLD